VNVPVRFNFNDFCSELKSLKKIAGNFLDRSAGPIVDQTIQQLDLIQSQRSSDKSRFEVDEQRPLRSICGRSFEGAGRKAGFDIFGTASWAWDITPVSNGNKVPKEFIVTGIASTKIRVFRVDDDGKKEIAMWRVEMGDLVSPGTYFHTQILGESEETPFPHALPIPRLPSIFVTPMSAVEFMLSELFQDKWSEHATGDRDDLKFWNQIQRRHLKSMLEWKMKQVENNQGSPWVALKQAKPRADESLFVKGGR